MTIVVRKGNPKGIKTWEDLVKPGIKIVTPNPGSSGSAKWNILARTATCWRRAAARPRRRPT